MKKSMIIVAVLFILCDISLFTQPLITPDTVYISPAYYNPDFEDVGASTLFKIKIDNGSGVEIISINASYNLNPANPNDKTIINGYPLLFIQKTGNIILEDKSIITMEAVIFFRSPELYTYEDNIYINFKTKEGGFGIDTVHVIAKRVDSNIFTLNQKLTRESCEDNQEPESFTVYSTLFKSNKNTLSVDSIKYRSSYELNILGYINKLFDHKNPPMKIDFPYSFNESYLTTEIKFDDSLKKDNFIYIDYYTEKGIFIDTVSIAYSKKKGITAKSYYQTLKSLNFEKVESNSLGLRQCSENGYKIHSIRLEGEIDESEIDFQSFFEIGEIINKPLVELAKFEITPQKIHFDRSGAYVYELENIASGNIITVDFPFTLKIDLSTDVADYASNGSLIYPNPVKDILNISSEVNIMKLEIINALGTVIFTEENSNSINVEGIGKGFYFIRLTSNKNTFIEKIIIE